MRRSPRKTAVVACDGRLDPASLEAMTREVSVAMRAGDRVVVIDLSAVGPISNDTLCQLCRTLRGFDGARVRVTGADLRVRRVLTLCAIDGLELAPSITSQPLRRPPALVRFLRARVRRAVARLFDLERFPSRPLS